MGEYQGGFAYRDIRKEREQERKLCEAIAGLLRVKPTQRVVLTEFLKELLNPNSGYLAHAEQGNYHFVEGSPLYIRASTYDQFNSIKLVEFYVQNPWGQYQKVGDDHSKAAANASYYDMILPAVKATELTLKAKGITHDGRVINSQPVTIVIKPLSHKVHTHAKLSQPMMEFSGSIDIAKDQIASIATIWDGFVTNRAYDSNNIWFGLNPVPLDYVQTHTVSHQVITKSGEVLYSKPQQLVVLAQDCAKDWQAQFSYWPNDFVYYQGFVYRSSHWSYNQAPNAEHQWGPWELVAECE